MDVTELMSRSVVVTTPEESIGRALYLLEDSGVRHLPVVTGGRVVGMLSDRDVHEYRLPSLERIDNQELADEMLARPVEHVMSRSFVSIGHRDSVATAIDAMLEHGVSAVPVLDRETGELRGMLSYVDVLRFARASM